MLKSRAGKKRSALRKANNAPKVIPINRKGNDNNQTRGKRISASNANGQHRANKMHQSTNTISAFILFLISPF